MDERLVQSIDFVRELAGSAVAFEQFDEREAEKRGALDAMLADLSPDLKKQIRAGLDLHVEKKGLRRTLLKKAPLIGGTDLVDRVGSEKLTDTEAATQKGYGLAADDAKRAHQALEQVIALTKKAIDAKGKDGAPLFTSPDEIEAEVFTPLVREGVLPDNFVIAKYSEVQKLLDATFKGYKQRLQDSVDAKQVESAKSAVNAAGGGSKTERISGKVGRAAERVSKVVDSIASEDTRRRLGIAADAGVFAVSAALAGLNALNWVPGENGEISNVTAAERQLNPEDYLETLSEERLAELGEDSDPDLIPLKLAEERREERITSFMTDAASVLKAAGLSAEGIQQATEAMATALDATDSAPARYTTAGIDLAIDAAKAAMKLALNAYQVYDIDEKLSNCKKAALRIAATREALKRADGAMIRALKPHGSIIVTALEHSLPRCIDSAALIAAVGDKPSGDAVVKVFAAALETCIRAAAPRDPASAKAVFEEGAKQVAAEFNAAVDVKKLKQDLQENPDAIGATIQRAVETAVTNGVKFGLADEWKKPAVARGMLGKATLPDDEAVIEEVERAQAETAAFERDLILIDEVGELAADKQAIDKMILKMEKEQLLLQAVSSITSFLAGASTGAATIAAQATEEVTFSFLGEVVGPIKAAKMVVELTIRIVEAVKRTQLLYKFLTGSYRAMKAKSPLKTAIQGLLKNKIEQTMFHTADDALTAIKLASTIVGSIPNEYAMAAGKTASLVATATQEGLHVANAIYNEVKLAEAWKVTRAALDAPANRELGLEALKLNPTLGVHALAWAGFEKQPVDPIARSMLKQLGLTEQSLAASGTEAKVRKYLETVLYEDRKLVDPSKIVTDWAPKSVTLSTRDWFLTTSRAAQVATPKLRAGDDKAVLAALKVVDQQNVDKLQEEINAVVALVAELEQLVQTQSESGIEDDQVEVKSLEAEERAASVQKQLDKFLSEAQAAVDALNAYKPKTTDGLPHSEMANQVANFQKLAAERRDVLRKLETILAEVG